MVRTPWPLVSCRQIDRIDIIKLSLILLLGLWAVWQPTQARQSAFVAYAEPLRIAVAINALELQLRAAALASDGAVTRAEKASAEDAPENWYAPLLALFAGSLADADPQLLRTIEERLHKADRLASGGDFAALEKINRMIQSDLANARSLLIPETLARRPDFRAAVIAKLAVSHLGFAEAYEDAAKGETDAYPVARLTLKRVITLWDELKPDLPSVNGEMQPILQELVTAMPSAQVPAKLRDPEEVEVAALDLVFALERGLARPLLVRGFEPQLKLAQQQADQACLAAAEGQRRLALENALAGRFTYDAELGSTVTVVAPDLAANVKALWDQLAGTSDAAGAARGTCTSMQQAMTRVGEVLGI